MLDAINHVLCRTYIGQTEDFWCLCDKVLADGLAVDGIDADVQELYHTLLVEHDSEQAGIQLQNIVSRVQTAAPQAAPLFAVAVLACCLPQALDYYRQLGATEDIIHATFSDILRWITRYQRLHGRFGVDEYSWIVLAYAGHIFEIGSLQYQTFYLPWPVHGWQKDDGTLLLLAGHGVKVACDGYICDTNGGHSDFSFATTYREGVHSFSGHVYEPFTGSVSPCLETFETASFHQLFRPGDALLNLHIPAGADLCKTAVDASFEQAANFFAAIGWPCQAAACESWLLDPQLNEWMKPHSKVLDFAERFSRFRVYSSGSWAHRFIFGTDCPVEELSSENAVTSLQKSVLAHIRSGGEMFDTGGIVLL